MKNVRVNLVGPNIHCSPVLTRTIWICRMLEKSKNKGVKWMICKKCKSNNIIVQAQKRRKTPYVLTALFGVPILAEIFLVLLGGGLLGFFVGVIYGFIIGALIAIVIAIIPLKMKSVVVCQNCGHIQKV